MSTTATGFKQEEMEEIAAAGSGVEVSDEAFAEEDQAASDAGAEADQAASDAGADNIKSATHSQLRALAKLQQDNQVDHSIFETLKLNEGAKIRYTTTFDQAALFNSINSSSESIANHFNEEITVENIVITTAQVNIDINDDFSEKEDKPCIHFFCKGGLHLASVSNGIIRSAENLITCAIIPSPENPIVIRFKEITTKRGKAHTFDLVSC